MFKNLIPLIIYLVSIALFTSLVLEYGWNLGAYNYATIYGHLFFFPLIFFPLIFYLFRNPTSAILSFFKEEVLKGSVSKFKKFKLILISFLLITSFAVFIVDYFKPYYSPWEVKLNSDALSKGAKFDDSQVFVNYYKSLDSMSTQETPWLVSKKWPNIFSYLLDVGKLVKNQEFQKTPSFNEYSNQFLKDRKNLSSILKTENLNLEFQKSITGKIYYFSIYSIILVSLFHFTILILYFIANLNLRGAKKTLLEKYEIRKNFLAITIALFCFLFWFAIRFSFLKIQNRFLEDVSLNQEVGPLLLYLGAAVITSIFWLFKYKDAIIGSVSVLLTIAGMIFSYLQPEFIVDIFSNIATYLILGVLVIITFVFIGINNFTKKSLQES